MGLIDSLEDLVLQLGQLGSPVGHYLNPGLPETEVVQAAKRVGADLHPDVVKLFGWHDGFDVERWATDSVDLALFPGFEFRPFADALSNFELSREIARDTSGTPIRAVDGNWTQLVQDDLWSPAWFPIVGLDGRSLFIKADRDSGSVWYDPLEDDKRRVFNSLEETIGSIRSAIDDGKLVLDGGVLGGEWIPGLNL